MSELMQVLFRVEANPVSAIRKGIYPRQAIRMLRRSLYEAANIILTRLKRPCTLQAWGKKMAEAKGPRRAKVAVARKLAALLHSVWLNETEFLWV